MASHAPTALELRLSRELRVSRRRVKRVGGAALLPLGVITTLASKLAYEMRAHDAPFHKPLFMTLVSFVAMSLCALPQMWHSFRRDARRRDRRRERARLEASRDARRSREASHDPNPRDGDAAASDGAGLAEPLLAETDAEETEAFFSDYDRSDGGAARTSQTNGQTVGFGGGGGGGGRARFRGFVVRRRASLMSRLAPVAFADVLATALISHAVLRLPLSAFLSLRHFQLVFAAAVATALRRELNPLHKLGVSLSLSGAALVVLSVEIAEADAAGRARAASGVACLFLSQLTQALALTFETRAAVAEEDAFGAEHGERTSPRAPRRRSPSPATALGIEGALGTAFLLCVVMPLAQVLSGVGSGDDSTGAGDSTDSTAVAQRSTRRIVAYAAGEDSFDTARALFANRDLSALVVCYLFALAAYNHAGAAVSRVMGVMSRTKLETSRTLLCWALAATLQCGSLGDGANERNENETCFPGEASVPPRLTAARFAGFVMGTLGTLLYGRGDAAERQRVFERDVTYKRAYASGRGPPRGARRRRGARGGFGGAREVRDAREARDAQEASGAFFVGGDFAVGDAASEDDVESAARATDARRLSSSTTRGFGSPVGPVGSNARTGLVTVSGDEDETRDDENGLKASLEERLSGYGRESGFGSGSLRSSMAFSSFGGEAAPRSAARARVGRSGADAPGASGPARVVSGFPEDAT